jgi:hypothetical protein
MCIGQSQEGRYKLYWELKREISHIKWLTRWLQVKRKLKKFSVANTYFICYYP